MRVAERYYSDKQDDMEKARTVIDICEKQSKIIIALNSSFLSWAAEKLIFSPLKKFHSVEDETEECSIAGKLANCVIEEAQRVSDLNRIFLEI